MNENKVSRRGVYKDLSLSPYVYTSTYGDVFKFPSQKKLDIYTRDVKKEIERVAKCIERLNLNEYLPDEIIQMLYRYTYQAFYKQLIEG